MSKATRISTSLAASLALVVATIAGANAVNAAPGDVTEVNLAAGSTPRGIAQGPDNYLWVTGGDSNTVAKISPEGAVTAYALPLPGSVSIPWGIAAGPDGNMWFTLQNGGKLGRITTAGAVSLVDLPDSTMQPRDIAAGSDNNMWFTVQGGQIGRVTMSGDVTMFDVPWAGSQPRSITPGPVGSNRLYFTDPGADRVAEIYTSGQIVSVAQLTTDSDPAGIAVINNAIWFAMSATSKIGQLVAVNTVLELSIPGVPTELTEGAGDTMWISLAGSNSVAKYSSNGGPIATYSLTSPNSLPGPLVEGPNTNIWVTQRNAGKVARIVSGQLPVVVTAPVITPASGVQAGGVLSVSNGEWTYGAGSFAYRWQLCSSSEDLSTCADIAGATTNSYTASQADVGKFIRAGVQGINASGPGDVSFSPTVGIGVTPTGPPPPVTGGQTVTIAQGVSLTLRAPARSRAGKKKSFAVVANTGDIKGKLRITINDSAGRERQVVAKGRWLKPLSANTKRALKRKKISRSLSPGTYTVKAVFTPTPAFRDNYPVATMSKVITIRPPR